MVKSFSLLHDVHAIVRLLTAT